MCLNSSINGILCHGTVGCPLPTCNHTFASLFRESKGNHEVAMYYTFCIPHYSYQTHSNKRVTLPQIDHYLTVGMQRLRPCWNRVLHKIQWGSPKPYLKWSSGTCYCDKATVTDSNNVIPGYWLSVFGVGVCDQRTNATPRCQHISSSHCPEERSAKISHEQMCIAFLRTAPICINTIIRLISQREVNFSHWLKIHLNREILGTDQPRHSAVKFSHQLTKPNPTPPYHHILSLLLLTE